MQKWDVIRVFCDFLVRPHDKFCICICPDQLWFMFINSNPPEFRKARGLAVEIANHEAMFLGHTSYVDTTMLQTEIPAHLVERALRDEGRRHGGLAPFLRTRIIEGVAAHEVMEPAHRDKVIEG